MDIRNNYKITIPEEVASLVAFAHPVYGLSIQWNIDQGNRVAVLSKALENDSNRLDHSLNSERYIPLERTNISVGSSITLIQEVRNRVEWDAEIGSSVSFIANSKMVEGEDRNRNSVYIVGEDIVNAIFERGVSGGHDYKEILEEIPE